MSRLVLAALASCLLLACDAGDDPDAGARDGATSTDAEARDGGRGDASPGVDATVGEDGGPPPIVLRDLKAFPTAEGYGAEATGGRGGRVLFVTTTEDTGEEGSLRWALQQDYPRIVYFLVGGAFVLDSLLYVDSGDLTIAGETANDLGGVHIRGADATRDCRLYFSEVENVIIRFISVEYGWRQWENDGTRHNPMTLEGVYDIIIDHYTGGFGSYVGGSPSKANRRTRRGGRATTQRSLLHEGVAGHNTGGVGGIQMDWVRSQFPESERAEMWAAWEGFSNHHNAFIGLTHRFYNTSGNGEIADHVVNNYVYGWYSRMSRHTNGNQPIDLYRNVYEAAPYNQALDFTRMHKFDFNDFYNLSPPVPVAANFFIAENLILDRDGSVFLDPSDDAWPMLTHFRDSSYGRADAPVSDEARRSERAPEATFPITLTPVDEVKDDVLGDCGSAVRFAADGTRSVADPIDARYLGWAREGGGPSFISERPGDGGLGDSATFVFPDYPSERRDPATLDADGVPLDWEPPADVVNEAGYARLELYLADVAGDFHRLRARR